MLIFDDMKHYNYIFAGAGLASLMTVYKMAVSGRFDNKSILMLDIDNKKANDRTWCYWEKGSGPWDAIVMKSWDTAIFADQNKRTDLDFDGYSYKMIRGLDFYDSVLAVLKEHDNIDFINQKVTDFVDMDLHVLVKTNVESYTCNKLFNSIYNPPQQSKYPLLQQHFIGWHIKTDTPAFDEKKATFMDFSIAQKGNTRFMYVLPFAPGEAIVEYTLFSEKPLPETEYEQAIEDYLNKMGIEDYAIIAEEKGSIPMTSYPFWENNTKNIMHIGSAGGWTKASTGYTFKNANKRSGELVTFLEKNNDVSKFYNKNRYWLYDLLLLDILSHSNHKGSAIFSALFRSGKAAPVFKFLDEETTLAEDLKVISKCPKRLFIKALFRRLANL